ncbi:MAG TPA: hypothetical protein VLB74_12380 [Flavobacterium sp.]|uniref:hypothetical protein n=1 Tax=Flavobacterium sp. TaxID=239 RepID=UPI002B57A56C|nr:hypothetical protein [Flavobacterium sp.]HSD15439.1 hypothetical protein [Flavobacterium sp.]
MSSNAPLLKKQYYPINEQLYAYLEKYRRVAKTNVFYDDLRRFQGSVVVYDNNNEDTLWVRVYYNELEKKEIDLSLKKIYTLLHSDGDERNIINLTVDYIDFCTFGNSKPFRVKIRNLLNDNYTHFYVKIADASRIFGLELEHIMSPNSINFLVHKETLIEEHIVGIPGDVFLKHHLDKCTENEKAQIAKEFVKFNERCMIGLLGDMRSYNFVVIPIYDYDHIVYKIRAIDFDQQCYEGNFRLYKPHLFKENFRFTQLVKEKLMKNSIEQYQNEERSILVRRIAGFEERLSELLQAMKASELSPTINLERLKQETYEVTFDKSFKNATSMVDIVEAALNFIKRNYHTHGGDQ